VSLFFSEYETIKLCCAALNVFSVSQASHHVVRFWR